MGLSDLTVLQSEISAAEMTAYVFRSLIFNIVCNTIVHVVMNHPKYVTTFFLNAKNARLPQGHEIAILI